MEIFKNMRHHAWWEITSRAPLGWLLKNLAYWTPTHEMARETKTEPRTDLWWKIYAFTKQHSDPLMVNTVTACTMPCLFLASFSFNHLFLIPLEDQYILIYYEYVSFEIRVLVDVLMLRRSPFKCWRLLNIFLICTLEVDILSWFKCLNPYLLTLFLGVLERNLV